MSEPSGFFINMEKDTYNRFKAACAIQGLTVQSVVAKFMEDYSKDMMKFQKKEETKDEKKIEKRG